MFYKPGPLPHRLGLTSMPALPLCLLLSACGGGGGWRDRQHPAATASASANLGRGINRGSDIMAPFSRDEVWQL